mmetsp:Transcript_101174/g.200970  ORF Transcript_101174/g.200970 Transcript_101174/m.200970 type:complete len:251 (-) Transcript_101174:86-838(-)
MSVQQPWTFDLERFANPSAEADAYTAEMWGAATLLAAEADLPIAKASIIAETKAMQHQVKVKLPLQKCLGFVRFTDSEDDDTSQFSALDVDHEASRSLPPHFLPLQQLPSGLPSRGSILHGTGACDPCAWFWKSSGCHNGENCGRCHACPQGEVKLRKKAKKGRSQTPSERDTHVHNLVCEPVQNNQTFIEGKSTECSGSALASNAFASIGSNNPMFVPHWPAPPLEDPSPLCAPASMSGSLLAAAAAAD